MKYVSLAITSKMNKSENVLNFATWQSACQLLKNGCQIG